MTLHVRTTWVEQIDRDQRSKGAVNLYTDSWMTLDEKDSRAVSQGISPVIWRVSMDMVDRKARQVAERRETQKYTL